MKFFLSFLQSPVQHPIAAYNFWEYYIKNGIEEARHTWIECSDVDWAAGLVPQSPADLDLWKSIAWENTIKYLTREKPSIFLSYLYPKQIDIQAIQKIKSMGIYTINFFCDNIRLFKKVPNEFKVFDLNWVPEFKARLMYQTANVDFLHLPMPMWVEKKYRTPSNIENTNFSFIGSKDIQRLLFFEDFVNHFEVDNLAIFGGDWLSETKKKGFSENSKIDKLFNQIKFIAKYGNKAFVHKMKQRNLNYEATPKLKGYFRKKPDFEDYIKITRESLITIGINRYPSFDFPLDQPNTYSRLRDIEAPMLGACYLTEWTEGLDSLYDIGTEIEVFTNIDDLYSKLKELEKNKKKRQKMRINAQIRALEKNSVVSSIQIIANAVS